MIKLSSSVLIAKAKVSLNKTIPERNDLLITHLLIRTNLTMFNFIEHLNISFTAHILSLLLLGIIEMQFCRQQSLDH